MKPEDKKAKNEQEKPLDVNPIKKDKGGREDNSKEENRIGEKEKPAKIQEPDRTAEKKTNKDERITNEEPDLDTTEGEMTPEEHKEIKKKIPTAHPGNKDL